MRNVTFVLLTFMAFAISAQSRLSVFIPQSVYMKGESIPIILSNSSDQFLYVYIDIWNPETRSCKSSVNIKCSTSSSKTYSVAMPPELDCGTSIIEVYYYNLEGEKIDQSVSAIQVLDNDCKKTLYKIEGGSNLSQISAVQTKINPRGTLSSPFNSEIHTITDTLDTYYRSQKVIASSTLANKIDTAFRFFFLHDQISGWTVFNSSNLTTKRIYSNSEKNNYFYKSDQELSDQFSLIHIFNNRQQNMNYIKSFPNISLTAFSQNDVEYLYKNFNKFRDELLINSYFTPAASFDKEIVLESGIPYSKASNLYKTIDYLEFENLTIFFKEVVLPSRIRQEKNEPAVFLLREDVKEFFSSPAKIFIDGRVVTQKEFFELNWKDILFISIFRNNKVLVSKFGPLGNHGVIAIQTKKPSTMVPGFVQEYKNFITLNNFQRTWVLENKNFTHNDRLGVFDYFIYNSNTKKWENVGKYSVE